MTDEKETIAQAIRRTAALFERAGVEFGHGTGNALDDAAFLVLSALRLPPEVPAGVMETRLTDEEGAEIGRLIDRRLSERLPTAYLTGTAWFCGLKFHVNEQVLVPRSPLAELIERGFHPWLAPQRPVRRILDIGTGSGCIAVACAYAFPEAQVDAVDISDAALAVARRNISDHGLSDRVHAIHSDLFAGFQEQNYDVIISNPPYVSDAEMAALPEEYLREPALGLHGGTEGLDVTVRILRGAARYLAMGGILIVEVGNAEEALSARFPTVPFLWLEFERGGHGVFLLTAEQLHAAGGVFNDNDGRNNG